MEDIFHLGIKALIRNPEGRFILLKVNEDDLKDNKHGVYWDLPGGRIQRGESIEKTLQREVEEETGIKEISNIRHLSTVVSNIRIPQEKDDVGLILSIYEVDAEGSDIKLSAEHTEASWHSAAEAAELLSIKFPKEFTDKLKNLG